MKTYYDLSKEERKKYLKEFKKTPVGKEMDSKRISIIIFDVAIIAFDIFLDIILHDVMLDDSLKLTMSIVTIGWILLLIILDVYIAYINVNFSAWLKNKYDIKRW